MASGHRFTGDYEYQKSETKDESFLQNLPDNETFNFFVLRNANVYMRSCKKHKKFFCVLV